MNGATVDVRSGRVFVGWPRREVEYVCQAQIAQPLGDELDLSTGTDAEGGPLRGGGVTRTVLRLRVPFGRGMQHGVHEPL